MTVQYENRRGKLYYLHQGTTKTGKPKYYFSMTSEGELADAIPPGFEIYETPNAQVFLRRIPPKLITDSEMATVEQGMKMLSSVRYYQIDRKKNIISIFLADQDVDLLFETFERFGSRARVSEKVEKILSYSPMLQFVLVDAKKRLFIAKRYCFLGSIDDWIEIGEPDLLPELVKQYVPHLDQDSYFELF